MVFKLGVISLDLQGHLAILTHYFKKQLSTSFLYIDLGRPMGVTHPQQALVFVHFALCQPSWVALFGLPGTGQLAACFPGRQAKLLACKWSTTHVTKMHIMKNVPMLQIIIILIINVGCISIDNAP